MTTDRQELHVSIIQYAVL